MLQVAKQIKAENHYVEWEIIKNHVCQQHIIEKIRALQLLRVTKGCLTIVFHSIDFINIVLNI